MAYNAKTDWQDRDPFQSADANRIEQGVADAHINLTQVVVDIANLKNRVQLIESTYPDSFQHNLFTEDLTTINSITLTHGYYNVAQSRLEA